MKALWLNIILLFSCVFVSTFVYAEQTITRKEALIIAEATKEVEGLYSLYGGKLKNCIEIKVLATCESDWVTCIEDAWIVQFEVGDVCPVRHDGRVGITFLIDALSKNIISRYPESAYFENTRYCQGDDECLCVAEEEENICLNFIHGQLSMSSQQSCSACACRNNLCTSSP